MKKRPQQLFRPDKITRNFQWSDTVPRIYRSIGLVYHGNVARVDFFTLTFANHSHDKNNSNELLVGRLGL